MKLLKNAMLGLAAAALMGGIASAATTVNVLHIVGSTAYRVAVTGAIINYLGGSGNVKAAYVSSSGDTQANLFGSGQAIFENSAGTQIVETYWTGSIAGVVDVVENTSYAKWFPTSQTVTTITVNTAGGSGSATTGGTPVTSIASPATAAPEVCMSDSFAGSAANLISTEGATGVSYANDINNDIGNGYLNPAGTGNNSNNDTQGIVPFGWWLGNSSVSSGVTNITQQSAFALTQAGFVPVSLLNGSAANKNDFFYFIGRNEDSGTRTGYLVESQGSDIPANNITAFGDTVKQNQITFSSPSGDDVNGVPTSGTAVTGLFLWPASNALNTEPTLNWNTTGHSGYIAGGDVKHVLSVSNPATASSLTFGAGAQASENKTAGAHAYLISALGWSDGYGITSTGHTPLTYNGVALSAANILTGEYSFWTYEHMYYLTNTQSNAINVQTPDNQDIADGIANLVYSTFACTDANGNTATASWPVAASTVNANEDQLTGTDGAAPAGILINSGLLEKRIIEGGPLSLTY